MALLLAPTALGKRRRAQPSEEDRGSLLAPEAGLEGYAQHRGLPAFRRGWKNNGDWQHTFMHR